jgi:hypothetical protein
MKNLKWRMKKMKNEEYSEKQTQFNTLIDWLTSKPFPNTCSRRKWDAAITLNVNKTWSIYKGNNVLKDFHANLDRVLLGNGCSRKRTEERTFFLVVPAYGPGSGKLHYHGLISLPNKRRPAYHAKITDEIDSSWKSVAQAGSTHVDWIDSQKHLEKCAWYSITEKSDSGACNKSTKHIFNYVSSDVFSPRKARLRHGAEKNRIA